MQTLAFLIALSAVVLGIIDYARTRSLLALALTLFVLAYIVQTVWHGGGAINVNG